jgi:hypothetical protein
VEHVWIGSVFRLPECVDVRRSASRRSAPAGAGKSVRQTAAAARISSTLLAARMPRRSEPSYRRTWSRRSGAFQYSHRNPPMRQTIANRRGTASAPIGILRFQPVRMSWVQHIAELRRRGLSYKTRRGRASVQAGASSDSACRHHACFRDFSVFHWHERWEVKG